MTCKACFLPNDPPSLWCLLCSFWEKVTQLGWDECWLWTGSTTDNGYGKWRGNYVHRVAWTLWNERTPTDQVLHTCDVKLCCNPHHLYDGDHLDNVRDNVNRRRYHHAVPEEAHNAALTVEQVAEIRSSRGESQRALGRKFGVSHATIGNVLRGETYSRRIK